MQVVVLGVILTQILKKLKLHGWGREQIAASVLLYLRNNNTKKIWVNNNSKTTNGGVRVHATALCSFEI